MPPVSVSSALLTRSRAVSIVVSYRICRVVAGLLDPALRIVEADEPPWRDVPHALDERRTDVRDARASSAASSRCAPSISSREKNRRNGRTRHRTLERDEAEQPPQTVVRRAVERPRRRRSSRRPRGTLRARGDRALDERSAAAHAAGALHRARSAFGERRERLVHAEVRATQTGCHEAAQSRPSSRRVASSASSRRPAATSGANRFSMRARPAPPSFAQARGPGADRRVHRRPIVGVGSSRTMPVTPSSTASTEPPQSSGDGREPGRCGLDVHDAEPLGVETAVAVRARHAEDVGGGVHTRAAVRPG